MLPKAKVNVIKSTSGKSTAEQLGKLDRLCTLSQLICPGTHTHKKSKPLYANVELNKCPKAEYIPGWLIAISECTLLRLTLLAAQRNTLARYLARY